MVAGIRGVAAEEWHLQQGGPGFAIHVEQSRKFQHWHVRSRRPRDPLVEFMAYVSPCKRQNKIPQQGELACRKRQQQQQQQQQGLDLRVLAASVILELRAI